MTPTTDARLDRARRLLRAPGAWVDQADGLYLLRQGADRRARVHMRLTEAELHALIEAPGLKPRPNGGWSPRANRPQSLAVGAETPAQPGRPGVIEGRRIIVGADGRSRMARANLATSPVLWLASRLDASGQPWLTPAEVAAAERLRKDAEIAMADPSLTMRWDALPRSASGAADRGGLEPGERALTAGQRVETALAACGPALRPIVSTICIRETALQTAERELGLPRRDGKHRLKAGLQALARHYRIG